MSSASETTGTMRSRSTKPRLFLIRLIRSGVTRTVSVTASIDVIDLEQEALAETGNIILNGCLATIANVLHRTMRMSLPSIVRGDGARLFEVNETSSGGQFVLFLYIDFNIKKRDVHGFIALLMDLPSIAALKDIVNDFVSGIEKQPLGHVG
jgi:chemotaxis protein CheC